MTAPPRSSEQGQFEDKAPLEAEPEQEQGKKDLAADIIGEPGRQSRPVRTALEHCLGLAIIEHAQNVGHGKAGTAKAVQGAEQRDIEPAAQRSKMAIRLDTLGHHEAKQPWMALLQHRQHGIGLDANSMSEPVPACAPVDGANDLSRRGLSGEVTGIGGSGAEQDERAISDLDIARLRALEQPEIRHGRTIPLAEQSVQLALHSCCGHAVIPQRAFSMMIRPSQ